MDKNDNDKIERFHAIYSSVKKGDTTGIPMLREFLHDEDESVRWITIDLVSQLDCDLVAPLLKEVYESGDDRTREGLMFFMHDARNQSMGALLMRGMQDKNREVAITAAKSLGGKSAILVARKILNEAVNALPEVPYVVKVDERGEEEYQDSTNGLTLLLADAIETLGKLGDTESIPMLKTLWKKFKRREHYGSMYDDVIAIALGRLGDNSGLPIIRGILKESDEYSIAWLLTGGIIEAVEKLGDTESIPVLKRLWKSCKKEEFWCKLNFDKEIGAVLQRLGGKRRLIYE